MSSHAYTEESIRSLDWREHIRQRPGMYIGKLGDGLSPEDGIYILLKEVLDNSIDEHIMGHGDRIEITVEPQKISVRDYGRGIPLGKLMDCAAQINTGAKYDSKVFKRSVGLNGVGIKAVNALSSQFHIQAFRERKTRAIDFAAGLVVQQDEEPRGSRQPEGTLLEFTPDATVFNAEYAFQMEFIEEMVRFYSYLHPGLQLILNSQVFQSKNGLADLLAAKINSAPLYPVVRLTAEDVDIAFTHVDGVYTDEYYSFVNGQHTTQGGTHLAAFREAFVKEVRDYYKKQFEPADVRTGLVAAISVKIEEPVFESQTKTKLGSTLMEPNGRTVRNHITSFTTSELDNFLHRHNDVAEALLAKVLANELERKEISGIQKMAKDAAKKARVHNSKLRDCRVHYDTVHKERHHSTLFITEGDSATGSITSARDPLFQAVFSLRGKPLNCFGLTRKVVYQNEEFNLLQFALNIEESVDQLRYNRVVLATDADVDGMHIRLLMMTFFLQFFPDLVRKGHLYILKTPLFRVRNKQTTRYCYSEAERLKAIRELGKNPEITRFKGLGEISPHEIKHFIGPKIRLEQVPLAMGVSIRDVLTFYMGKNTPDRASYIIDNLRTDLDALEAPEMADAV